MTVAVTPDRFWGAWPKPVFATMADKPGFFGRVNETWTDTSPLRDGESLLDVTAWGEGRAIAAIKMAEADIRFDARASATAAFPFPVLPQVVRKLTSEAGKLLRERLPGEKVPGIHITPHAVTVRAALHAR